MYVAERKKTNSDTTHTTEEQITNYEDANSMFVFFFIDE